MPSAVKVKFVPVAEIAASRQQPPLSDPKPIPYHLDQPRRWPKGSTRKHPSCQTLRDFAVEQYVAEIR